VELPQVLERYDAEYPADATSDVPIEVVLFVTIDVHGHVTKSEVAEPTRTEFAAAAEQAVKHWRFTPATRDGKPVVARIRVPFLFPVKLAQGDESRTVDATKPPSDSAPFPVPVEGTVNSTELQSGDKDQTPGSNAPGSNVPGSNAPGSNVPGSNAPGSNAPDSKASEVIVQGHYRAPTRGSSDYHIDVGQLSQVPRKSASEMLQLAPGILLTNEGGEGHAQQVFLRGFDAREGQDIEFTVGGVPINEAGNLHGNGHADANFIIPETVISLRVLEGPFDPRQGNFAVAGSADYRLGLERRGLTLKGNLGSYGTQRILGLWGPAGLSRCTFGAAEIYKTDGFGQNRDAERASAVAQYEGKFGETGSYRLTGQAYSARYHSAGVIREDDYHAGRIGFYDTYDPRQGGDSSRYSLAADLEESVRGALFREQIYVIARDLRMRKNYTGFLLDVQEPTQNPHNQRGDGIDLSVDSWTLGSRGSSRVKEKLLGFNQELEVGYHARGDFGRGTQLRLQSSNAIPYQRDVDVDYALGDIGLYADANLRPLSWLTFRGGMRANYFSYDVQNNCAQKEVRQPSRSNPPGDSSCLDQQNFGAYRDPTARSSTATTALLPRASVLLSPTTGLLFSVSYGQGIRSIDPIYVSQDVKTPFARVDAYDAGVVYSRTLTNALIVVRTSAFRTHVSQDLIFSESAGRNTLANGTTRNGVLAALRLTGSFFDQSLNATLVRSRFDDTGLTVPYVPNWVLRSDSALHHELPFRILNSKLTAAVGAGVTFVGRRPLPYNQMSDTLFTVDASGSVSYRRFELGFEVTNLFDRRYRLGEYNYASNFQGEGQLPTLVPVRHFSAGPPRLLFLTLAVNFGAST
jgi:TonB family protein